MNTIWKLKAESVDREIKLVVIRCTICNDLAPWYKSSFYVWRVLSLAKAYHGGIMDLAEFLLRSVQDK